jgi:hypothetical protein
VRGDSQRYPGAQIEKVVVQQLAAFLASPERLSHALVGREAELVRLLPLAKEQSAILCNRSGSALRAALVQLVERVELGERHFQVLLSAEAFLGTQNLVLKFPAAVVRRTKGLTLVVPGEDLAPDPSLVALVAQGRCWFDELASGRAASIKAIAEANAVNQRYVGKLIEIGLLSPRFLENVMSGVDLGGLTAAQLKNGRKLAVCWDAQHHQLQGPVSAHSATGEGAGLA